MSIYQIRQNPDFDQGNKRIKPIHPYRLNEGIYDFYGRRNINGLHELKEHDVEVDQSSFGVESALLERVQQRLRKLNIEAKLI